MKEWSYSWGVVQSQIFVCFVWEGLGVVDRKTYDAEFLEEGYGFFAGAPGWGCPAPGFFSNHVG